MKTSEQLNELAKALCKAQATIQTASKDSVNPHFKSKYADLASVWDACRQPLTQNGLSVVQLLSNEGVMITCTTILLHESGQFIMDLLSMTPQQNTPQAAGSCATYLRRYSLQAIVGVAPDDDDGNAASAPTNRREPTNDFANKNVIKKTVVEVPVATPSAALKPNPPTPATFDRNDKGHVAVVNNFLGGRKQLNLLDSLCDRLHGKAFTQSNIRLEFSAIDAEKPDQSPDED